MSRRSTKLLKAALSALHYSGADGLMAPFTRGVGVIFMLHNVRPETPDTFEPNRILKVTPEFLDIVIHQVVEAGFDILSINEAHHRLSEGSFERPFACFTFDDGYKDNREFAYPIFAKYGLPFTIYIPTDFPDGRGDLWWLALEKIVSEVASLKINMDGTARTFRSGTGEEKDATFHEIYWWLRGQLEHEARAFVRELCRGIGFNPDSMCAELIMNWDEIRGLATDPLVTIGAHTRGHYALAKLSLSQARSEVEESVRRIEQEIGIRPQHFSYPYGCERSAGPRDFELVKELGLKTGVTTRKGLILAEHVKQLTGLPRVSLNGDFQDERYVKVLLTGAPFAFWNAFQRVTKRQPAA